MDAVKLSTEEVRERVLYAALTPAARLASRFGVPVRDLSRLSEISYYREARRRRLKMRQIQDLMSISMSKAASLSKSLKDQFALGESDHGVERRIMSLLWAEPLTATRIVRALDDIAEEQVLRAIDELVASERLTELPGRTMRYRLSSGRYRLVEDRWLSRFEALNSFMIAVAQAIEARFVQEDDRAFVRTLRFRVNPEDLPRLHAHYEQLFELINELDDAVEGDDPLPVRLSLLWAPDVDSATDSDRGRV